MTGVLLPAAALALSGAGIAALRHAWDKRTRWSPWLLCGGWAACALAVALCAVWLGGEVGVPFGITLFSIVALAVVATHVRWREVRSGPSRASAADPSDRPRRLWRGLIRVLLAGPLSGLAAVGVGVALAKGLPLGEADRIAIGGLTVPLLWAGGMVWTLADDRILRALAVLILSSVAAYTAAFI